LESGQASLDLDTRLPVVQIPRKYTAGTRNAIMTRILSVDDEPELLELLTRILKRSGYESLTTTDNLEALHRLCFEHGIRTVLRQQAEPLLTEEQQ
jgi:PleD family two-component response regulator